MNIKKSFGVLINHYFCSDLTHLNQKSLKGIISFTLPVQDYIKHKDTYLWLGCYLCNTTQQHTHTHKNQGHECKWGGMKETDDRCCYLCQYQF